MTVIIEETPAGTKPTVMVFINVDGEQIVFPLNVTLDVICQRSEP